MFAHALDGPTVVRTAHATLYLGDALDVLPTLDPVDLLVTDPPYGIAYTSSMTAAGTRPISGDEDTSAAEAIVAAAVARLRPHRHLYVFHSPKIPIPMPASVVTSTPMVWDKGALGMGNLSLPHSLSHESILMGVHEPSRAGRDGGKGRLSARLRGGSVLRVQRPIGTRARKHHPTEKPVELVARLIESSSCRGELVLDPCMGSGSTVVAAILSGRSAVGVEIDPAWFSVAVERIQAAEEIRAAMDAVA